MDILKSRFLNQRKLSVRNWAPNWTRGKLSGRVGCKVWPGKSPFIVLGRSWALALGCALCVSMQEPPKIGPVHLLWWGDAPGQGQSWAGAGSAAHPGWGHSFPSYPHHVSSDCSHQNHISHEWAHPTCTSHPAVHICPAAPSCQTPVLWAGHAWFTRAWAGVGIFSVTWPVPLSWGRLQHPKVSPGNLPLHINAS